MRDASARMAPRPGDNTAAAVASGKRFEGVHRVQTVRGYRVLTGSMSARSSLTIPTQTTVAAKASETLGSGVQLHESGLLFTSRPSLEAGERVGVNIFSFAESAAWWIADWLGWGESKFSGRHEGWVKRTTRSYPPLRNYPWVARKFPLSRRRPRLRFSPHLEVVALH